MNPGTARQQRRIPAPQRCSYPLRAGNRVALQIDGVCAFSAIAAAVRAARSSVWVTVAFLERGFAFADGVGFFELLAEAAARGVDVRALLWRCCALEASEPGEHFPGTPEQRAWLDGQGGGVRIRWDRSLGAHCQHQKSWLIDAGCPGEIAFVGGINLDRASLAQRGHAEPGGSTHDVYASVQGPCASDVHHGFVQRWNSATERGLPDGCWPSPARCDDLPPPLRLSPALGTQWVQLQRTLPQGQPLLELPLPDGTPTLCAAEYAIREQYLLAVRAARSTIYLENQALLSLELARALHAALERGVQVMLLVPRAPFSEVAAAHGSREYAEFFECFARLGEHPGFLLAGLIGPQGAAVHVHSKVLIADDEWIGIGSANAMDRSFERDTELNLAIWSDELALQLGRELVAEFTAEPLAAAQDHWQRLRACATARGPRRGLVVSLDPRTYAAGALAPQGAPQPG